MLPQQDRPMTESCCRAGPQSPLRSRRGWDLVAGALSIALWVMIPKCPVCVAAHVALWTGLGLSFAEASYLRSSLVALCAALVLAVIAKRIDVRWVQRRSA